MPIEVRCRMVLFDRNTENGDYLRNANVALTRLGSSSRQLLAGHQTEGFSTQSTAFVAGLQNNSTQNFFPGYTGSYCLIPICTGNGRLQRMGIKSVQLMGMSATLLTGLLAACPLHLLSCFSPAHFFHADTGELLRSSDDCHHRYSFAKEI